MKIELHAHTAEVSPCGKMPAEELVRRYAEAGYDALVVTDHLVGGRNKELPMRERADRYLSGYRAARKAGEERGVQVFLGAEVRFASAYEDILIFGVEESDIPWLYAVMDAEIGYQGMYDVFHARGLLVVQAHPFRPNLNRIPYQYLDGSEAFNGHPGHDSRNDLAMEFAVQGGPGFIKTSGSDAHEPHHVARGGIETDQPIADSRALADYLRAHPEPRRIEIW